MSIYSRNSYRFEEENFSNAFAKIGPALISSGNSLKTIAFFSEAYSSFQPFHLQLLLYMISEMLFLLTNYYPRNELVMDSNVLFYG